MAGIVNKTRTNASSKMVVASSRKMVLAYRHFSKQLVDADVLRHVEFPDQNTRASFDLPMLLTMRIRRKTRLLVCFGVEFYEAS
jgi:hypothetical protein